MHVAHRAGRAAFVVLASHGFVTGRWAEGPSDCEVCILSMNCPLARRGAAPACTPLLLRVVAGLCSLLGSAGALAQAPAAAATLEPVVVTGSRVAQSLDDALPATTLLTRADIERAQTSSLVELLGRTAGVEFARSGGPGAQSSLFVRGAGSSQVLVLVDGVRINTAIGGAAILGGITVDAIERIEIVRGNLSSLYGSEAVGGVIQIFTRDAVRSGAEAAVEVGQGDSRALRAGYGYRAENTRVTLNVAERQEKPFSAIDVAQVIPGPFAPGANPDLDASRLRSLQARIESTVGGAQVGASAWLRRQRVDFDSTADGPTATHRETSRADVLTAFAQGEVSPGWRLRGQVSAATDDSVNRSSVPASFNNGEFNTRNRQVTLANEVTVAEGVIATVGLESLAQRGASNAFDTSGGQAVTVFTRDARSAWFGVVGRAGARTVQVNVRHDDYDDVGAATTGLVAYGYQWAPAWRLSAQWSNAFRAPSFNELYFPFFGNPQLRPEKTRSTELGVRYVQGTLRVGLTAFSSRARDLIAADSAFRAANVAQAENRGVELTAAWRAERWRLDGFVSSSRPEDASTGQRLLRRAPLAAGVAAGYDTGRWSLGAQVQQQGARFDSDINTFARTRLDGYVLARLTGRYVLSPALALTARVENLLDERYELIDGYNTPRRSAYAGVVARF
jgi:vitamin B12 transporter